MHESVGMLDVTLHPGELPTVKLSGEADFHNRSQIHDAFDRLLSQGENRILADLSELQYMDSSALSTLVKHAAAAMEAGGQVELVGMSPQVSRVLVLSGAVGFFESHGIDTQACHDSRSQAVGSDFWHVSQFSLPANPKSAAIARSRIADVVGSLPFTESEAQDIGCAVGEALSNAIKHGCRCNPDLRITVRCIAGSGQFSVEITDPGPGFDPDAVPPPSLSALREGGYGIHVMRQLMDDVSFEFGIGTTIRLTREVAACAEAQAVDSRETVVAAG